MNGCFRCRGWRSCALRRLCAGDGGSQIVEFALSLPLLVLFVVGIFDFSGALSLKQKLTNAAREGARVAAADPANDLGDASSVAPASVIDAFYVVDNYLISEKINDCGLSGPPPPTPTQSTLTWTYTATGSGCPASGITLTINRGCVTQQTSGTYAVNTCVTILYPYPWQFGGVAGLFGGSFALPAGITTTAVAFNEN
jgi:Flp pilus assembly protein TadG